MATLAEQWAIATVEHEAAREPFDRQRYNTACLARIALIHEGFNPFQEGDQ